MEITKEMQSWINNMKFTRAMGSVPLKDNIALYEQQIANMNTREKDPISDAQADLMQEELDKLKTRR